MPDNCLPNRQDCSDVAVHMLMLTAWGTWWRAHCPLLLLLLWLCRLLRRSAQVFQHVLHTETWSPLGSPWFWWEQCAHRAAATAAGDTRGLAQQRCTLTHV